MAARPGGREYAVRVSVAFRSWVRGAVLGAACVAGLAWAQGAPFQIRYSASSEFRAPLSVKFQATFPAGYRARWAFGDGGLGEGALVEHTYYRAGSYAVVAELLDGSGRVVSRAQGRVDVKSGGPEKLEVTVLVGRGDVRLSSVGSVLYSPLKPTLQLDGQPVGVSAVPLGPGVHTAVARGTAQGGGSLERRVTFTAAALGGSVPFETEVLRLTNRARANGWNCETLRDGGPARPPLQPSGVLDVAALAQSAGMALVGYFDHVSTLDGSTPMRRVQAAGLEPTATAENIAGGQNTPAEVVDAWLRSPGHCHNIMGDFTLIGVSYVNRPGGKYGHYWTQVFARP